jgi:hypothetical protein
MYGSCDTYREEEMCLQVIGGETSGNEATWKKACSCDNIKTDFKENDGRTSTG